MHPLPPNAINGDGFAMAATPPLRPPRALTKTSQSPQMAAIFGAGSPGTPGLAVGFSRWVLLTSIGHLEANGLHKDLAWRRGNLEMLETHHLGKVFLSFWDPYITYMCMNCCGFTAWYLSNLPYVSVARTCVFSYVNQCFTMLLGTSRPSTCRILTQVSLPQSDCFSLSCLAKANGIPCHFSLPPSLGNQKNKSQIRQKKYGFFYCVV